jgi:nicotinamidase/pyrazinamidase
VRATAIEALAQGYPTYVLTDVIRPVEVAPGDGQRALDAMAAAGVHFATSGDLTAQR